MLIRQLRPLVALLAFCGALSNAGSTGYIVAEDRPATPVDFGNEIQPLLSRYGCNAGGCHGKASGQNGFKLSLFGFDDQQDHDAIVAQDRGRRISLAAPQQSLLIQKAVGDTSHGGGIRFAKDSEAYELLVRWIAAGAPAASPDAPRVVQLQITPSEHVFVGANQSEPASLQLRVEAVYDNGSQRDITRHAVYASNLDPVASVNSGGEVLVSGQSGEAAIMARYMSHVAVFRAVVPHGPVLDQLPDFQRNNYVDELSAEKWMKLGLKPSPTCDDATFIRRVTIDVCGRLPSADETRSFLADTSSDKRAVLIDRLLDSPDYAAYFALRWGAILRNSRLAGADQASYAFHNWIRDLIARNRPYDELVRGVVAAAGEWQDAPAINWYWQMRDDQLHQVTSDTAQVFLGVRMQCARCHHHPYERWSQEDYYGLAGFFTRLGRKSFGQPPPYYASATPTSGEKNPLTDKTPEPKFPLGEYATFAAEQDPREALVDWMVQPSNPFFSRVLVNRLWGHFLGRGLVHEVDDIRGTNPAVNEPLLDALAKDFIDHKFDMKHVVRTILNSRVYQLSSEPTPDNADDRQSFARYYARRLIAEVFHDAVDDACGMHTQFGGVSGSARAVDLPNEGFGSYFLDTFDRPQRVSGCECERSSGATLAQVLLLSNSDEIENKIAGDQGRIAKALAEKRSAEEVITELYLVAYSRLPTDSEQQRALDYVASQSVATDANASAPDQRKALEDVLWSLLNSKEFMFNH